MPEHGEYRAGSGFFDSARNGWIADPAKLTAIIPGRDLSKADADQVASWGHRSTFKPQTDLENLRRLRDSDRSEERATFQQMAAGALRMQLSEYETARQSAIDSGTWAPDGAA